MQKTANGTERRTRRLVLASAVSAAVLLVAGGSWLALAPQGPGPSLIGGPFALQDGDGRTVTSDSLRGKPFLG